MMTGCYLLHFSTPYKHAAHYLGWAQDIPDRVNQHRNGSGARLPQVVVESGRELIVSRIWLGANKTTERRLKNQKNAPLLCPICSGQMDELEIRDLDFAISDLDELAF